MADFGVSAKMEAKDDDDAEGVSGIAGTMMWMAPEVYRSKTANYDWKCDVSAESNLFGISILTLQ